MTTLYPDIPSSLATPGVYVPQADSLLLIEAMQFSAVVQRRSVLDLCSGSGVVAIAAATLGARSVTAFDICERAVQCTRNNATAAGVNVDAYRGSCEEALGHGPFELVVCNPPYVPTGPQGHPERFSSRTPQLPMGPSRAWDAGADGRMVLDPLCMTAPELLTEGGTLILVQSEFADPDRSLGLLRRGRLYAEVVMTQIIPFGPVLTSRAEWMEQSGLLPISRREEELFVIRAEKP